MVINYSQGREKECSAARPGTMQSRGKGEELREEEPIKKERKTLSA